jgi:hypothetical protein
MSEDAAPEYGAAAHKPQGQPRPVQAALEAARRARRAVVNATDTALALLPAEMEASVRQRAKQCEPFAPHALCAVLGFFLGRWLGRRGARQRAAPARGTGRRLTALPLDVQLGEAEREAEAASREVKALHSDLQRLNSAVSQPRAAAGAGGGDDLRQRLEAAAAAYDTLLRVLEAERHSSSLELDRAALENELLRQQLSECRGNMKTLLGEIDDMQREELASMKELMAKPVSPRHRPSVQAAPTAAPPAKPAQQKQPETLAQAHVNEALGNFGKLFGI